MTGKLIFSVKRRKSPLYTELQSMAGSQLDIHHIIGLQGLLTLECVTVSKYKSTVKVSLYVIVAVH